MRCLRCSKYLLLAVLIISLLAACSPREQGEIDEKSLPLMGIPLRIGQHLANIKAENISNGKEPAYFFLPTDIDPQSNQLPVSKEEAATRLYSVLAMREAELPALIFLVQKVESAGNTYYYRVRVSEEGQENARGYFYISAENGDVYELQHHSEPNELIPAG